jgi:diguanylate cyclase (GGDEF)-like protein
LARRRSLGVDNVLPLIGGIWWVGKLSMGGGLPCHSFLVERGDQSVLFDPGNLLDPAELVRQIERIVPLDQVRYVVCHEATPADVAALLHLQRLIKRPDAVLITHSSSRDAWDQIGLEIPRWFADRNDWNLDLGGRALRFVPTPFAPSPGSFCTFDAATGTLFTSGLFGVMEGGAGLIANDTSVLDGLFLFHERRLPSREALQTALRQLDDLAIRSIAPHHGPMVPEHLVQTVLANLDDLECGLALMGDADSSALLHTNRLLREILHDLEREQGFARVISGLIEHLGPILPARGVELIVQGNRAQAVRLCAASSFVAQPHTPAEPEAAFLTAGTRARWHERHGPRSFQVRYYTEPMPDRPPGASADGAGRVHYLWLPLFSPADAGLVGLARIELAKPISISREVDALLARISGPLASIAEREVISQTLKREDDRYYQLVIRDPLTSLYTRRYFDVLGRHLIKRNARNPGDGFAVVLLDLDCTGELNTTLGAEAADHVFEQVSACLKELTRSSDVAVRYGGDEFLVFLHAGALEQVLVYVNRIREGFAGIRLRTGSLSDPLSFCAGIAMHVPGESLEALIRRADRALYRAKAGGRGRLTVAEKPAGR